MRTFDNLIIGFGKGGKTLAAQLAKQGQSTLMAEKSPRMYGGTCINVACLPTKSLENSARQSVIQGGDEQARQLHFYQAIEEKRRLTSMLRKKNYDKLDSSPNITVMDGTASFVSPHVVEVVNGEERFRVEGELIFINTGSSAFVPPIEGLKDNPYVYTSEGLLNRRELPEKLVIIGGGYIGVEFSSIYASFGSEVTILQDGDVFLPREDAEIAGEVKKSLEARGVRVLTGVKTKAVRQGQGKAIVDLEGKEGPLELQADAVLVATGRRPNTKDLNLKAAGVEVNARGGIITDDSLRTTAPHIYAMGDVRGGLQFTYISLDDFRIVRSAVLGDGSYDLKKRGAVPYSVFLDPPFSRVGLSEKEAVKAGYRVKTARLAAAAIPKAQVLEQPAGLLKAVIDEETGLILGAHLFCEESYELINMIKLAMDAKLHYTVLRDTIYTHPTMSEAFNDLFAI